MSAITQIVDQIKLLNALQLSELVKEIETTFGVSAAAPAAFAVAAPAAGGEAAAAEEKTEFKIVIKDAGSKKIDVIKALRAVLPALGLKEAKDMTEQTPAVVKESASKDEAEKIKKALQEAGATVELS